MAKLITTDLVSGVGSATVINDNFALVETAVEKQISRDGTAPNSMSVQLDLGANRIINVADAVNNQDVLTLAQANTLTGLNAPLTQLGVGTVLYPQTAAELAAGITPVNIWIKPLNVLRYGTNTTPGTTDMTIPIANAFLVARALVPTRSTQPDGALGYSDNGHIVFLPAGIYLTTALLEIPYQVILEGEGNRVSVIKSSFDGQILRTEFRPSIDPYNNRSSGIRNLRIFGDITKTSQVGLDILRFTDTCFLENVEVSGCGSIGILMRECVGANFTKVNSNGNVGDGIKMQVGIIDWGFVANALPCNANKLDSCISRDNDGAGLVIDDSNSNIVNGGYYQNNYDASGNNIGNNIEITGTSRNNILDGIWLEGKVNAHLHQNLDGVNPDTGNFLINSTIIALSTTNRAVICNKGTLYLENLTGNAAAFPSIGGSTAPFQCNKANVGRIFYSGPDHTGHGPGGFMLIEDENNNDANLNLFAQQNITDASINRTYGQLERALEHDSADKYFKTASSGSTTWEVNPWLELNPSNRGIAFGGGSTATDTTLYRGAANRLQTDDQFYALDGFRTNVTASITAFATGGQTGAVELTSDINEISIVATIADSVKLPTAVSGLRITIINNGANAADVFPNTSDNLGAGVNTAISLAAGNNITYASYDATNWESV